MSDTTSCTDAGLSPACTIDAVIARHPVSIHVLNAFGIDTCCGGAVTIEEAARHNNVDAAVLLDAIEKATAS